LGVLADKGTGLIPGGAKAAWHGLNRSNEHRNMNVPPIAVGLVGFGFAGRTFHAPVIRAIGGLRLAAIVERSGTDAADLYPEARVVRSLEQLLEIDSIRLVVLATPNPSHFELARACLLEGRDVVIDKPFATTYSEAAELVRLAKERGRLLSVYQNRRWDGDFMTVGELVRTSALGTLVRFESCFDRYRRQLKPGAWREQNHPGSGILFDLGPHLIDQALLLFGEPVAVYADIRCEREGAVVDDSFDLVLHYPRMRACLRASLLAAKPGPRFVLRGTQACFVKFGLDPQEAALKALALPTAAGWGQEPPEAWGRIYAWVGNDRSERTVPTQPGNYRRYYENIREALLGKEPVMVTPAAALCVMRILELARQSNAEKRVVDYS
jgi:scyllo-inositol 2-dehydrogenase (NADP+)